MRLWDALTRAPVGERFKCPAGYRIGAFTPDLKTVLVEGVQKPGQLFDIATGQPIGAPIPAAAGAWSFTFSPDGKHLFIGDPLLFGSSLWDATTGERTSLLLESVRSIFPIFSSDGRTIFDQGVDGEAQLLDVATGERLGQTIRYSGTNCYAVFSPNGRFILTAGSGEGAQLWDVATGRRTGQTLHLPREVSSAAFSPDGRLVLVCGPQGMWVWDATSAEPVGRPFLQEGPVGNAAFDAEARRLLVVDAASTKRPRARLWDVASGRAVGCPLARVGELQSGGPLVVVASSEGETLFIAGIDGTARLWSTASGERIGERLTHSGAINSAAFSSTSAVFWTPPGEHPASTKTSHLAGMEGIITVLVFRARRLAWPVYTQGGVGAAPKRSSAGLDPRGRRRAATRGGYIRRKRGKPAGSCEPSSNRRRPY